MPRFFGLYWSYKKEGKVPIFLVHFISEIMKHLDSCEECSLKFKEFEKRRVQLKPLIITLL